MTEVANRRHFEARLAEDWRAARRSASPTSVLYIDLDRFKQVNDALGHAAGDAVLRRVAGELRARLVRASDLLARVGGEEFCVLLPVTNQGGATTVAERLRAAIESLELPHPAGGVVTISVGVATRLPTEAATTTDGLLQAADAALYRAKANGRNRVELEALA